MTFTIIYSFLRYNKLMKITDTDLYHRHAAKILSLQERGVDVSTLAEYLENLHSIPDRLYKYRSANEYNFDSIANDYLYIPSADLMDDQFELAMSTIGRISPDDREEIEKTYLPYYLSCLEKDDLKQVEEYAVKVDRFRAAFSLKNQDHYVVEMLEQLEKIRSGLGIFSLSEEGANQVMWQMYGDNYKGFMIAYDMTSLPDRYAKKIVKVKYAQEREADPLKLYIDMLLGKSKGLGLELLPGLFEWILGVLATKNEEWAFQKEWRIIGKNAEKIKSPRIDAVYMGKHIKEEDRARLMQLSREKGFRLYDQYDDFRKMSIQYRETEADL